jgi:hypothetical protein
VNKDSDSITVAWSDEDGEWVATCSRYPSLSWLAASEVRARSGFVELVAGIVADQDQERKEQER